MVDVVGFDSEEEGARLICDVSSGAFFKAIVDCSLYINHKDWLWDAIGSIELDPDCGIVGGTILTPDYRILHIGYVAGLDGFFATPGYLDVRENVLGNVRLDSTKRNRRLRRDDAYPHERVGTNWGADSNR